MSTQNLGLPEERFAQLAMLADIDGKTMSDVVGDFLNDAIRAGRLPNRLPGWQIERQGGNVFFAASETAIERRWSVPVALAVAQTLEKLIVPGGRLKANLDLDANLLLDRRGVGVKITCPETGEAKVIARSIADDIAVLIRQAAA